MLLSTACGAIELPVLLTMDPNASNTFSLELPPLFGGEVVTTELVGNVWTTVFIDSNQLLNPSGVPATVRVDEFFTAGSPIDLNGLNTGPLCTFIPEGEEAGGIALLRPMFYRDATFNLTIPTTTVPADPNVAELLPPLPLALEIDTSVYQDLHGLLQLCNFGTGLTMHPVINTTIPDDVPLFGGSAVTLDVTLTSTRFAATDPLLDACAEANL
jgi:hypothetical protein